MSAPFNFKPLGSRLVVRAVKTTGDSKVGSLFVPESAAEKPQIMEVVAVGPGDRDASAIEPTPLTVKVGDKVLVSKYGGVEVKINGESYQILREDDVLGIIG
jgi:chaperonin GroES